MNRIPNEDIENEVPVIEPYPERREQYICFALGRERLSVKLASSPEVGYVPPITPLPNLPDWLTGIANIRGEIVSMVDLKGFLKIPGKGGASKGQRLIVVQSGEIKTGLLADKLLGILSPDRHEVLFCDYPQGTDPKKGLLNNYVEQTAVYKNSEFHVLDIEKLLACPRMNGFSK